MKHYLITGAAGFIGSHLAEALLQDEQVMVSGIDNFDSFYPREVKEKNLLEASRSSRFTFIEGDIRSDEWHAQLNGKSIDGIFHIAARAGVLPSIKDPITYEDVNIKGTFRMLELAKKMGVKQFVFASSSSVYGINPNIPWREDDPVLRPISPYANTKVANELSGFTYSHLYGIRFIALRLFTVFGPRQRPDLAIHKFIRNISEGKPVTKYGSGNTRRDYTYVGDIVSGLISAMQYNDSMFEIINLGNNKPATLNELISAIENATGITAKIEQLPEQPGDVPVTYADISKAGKLLNYHPKVSLQEGINRFYDWYKQQ